MSQVEPEGTRISATETRRLNFQTFPARTSEHYRNFPTSSFRISFSCTSSVMSWNKNGFLYFVLKLLKQKSHGSDSKILLKRLLGPPNLYYLIISWNKLKTTDNLPYRIRFRFWCLLFGLWLFKQSVNWLIFKITANLKKLSFTVINTHIREIDIYSIFST